MHKFMPDRIYLSVIIPCYNEQRNIRLGALENVSHFLRKKKWLYEVILVDDGSSDDSVLLMTEFIKDHKNFRLVRKRHQGKAAAVTAGIMESRGNIILFSDLDQATPINQIEKLLPLLSGRFDIAIGSRNKERKGAPFFRLAMARGFVILRNIILDLHIADTQCGFKAFRRQAALDIFPGLRVFSPDRSVSGSTVTAGFDVEVLYLARRTGYKIAEVPVEWHYQETRHINPVKDSIESFIDLIRIRWYSMNGKYG